MDDLDSNFPYYMLDSATFQIFESSEGESFH